MATTIYEQISEQLAVSTGEYSQSVSTLRQQINTYSAAVNNYQTHNLVVDDSSSEELLANVANASAVARGMQSPIQPPVA